MVFYRKYRPQTIDQLDLAVVREKFTAILSHADLPHAFLFTGPKGLGKTSSARILAKAINCEKKSKKSIEPCNKCDACVSITNGSNIDVLEIDAASNRGIDEIRELRERVKFAPSSLRKKVYIIDEVHMLTTEAFNALLKTLEEPPSHVVFILCTTEFWKLPSTIVSRAFHVQFEKPTCEEITRSLMRVAAGEGLEIEEGVYNKLFELCDGAFRDGTKILEELVLSSKDKKITLELLKQTYKTSSIEQEVRDLTVRLADKKSREALAIVEKLASNGADFKIVIEKMVEVLRMELLVKNGLDQSNPSLVSGGNFSLSDIEKLLELCNEAYKNLKFSVLPQLPLELLTVKWCVLNAAHQEVPRTKLQEPRKTLSSTIQTPNPSVIPEKVGIHESTVSPIKSGMTNGDSQALVSDQEFLKNLIDHIKKDNFTAAGVLRSSQLVKIGDSDVEIMAPFKFHGDRLRDAKVMSLLETRAAELLGKQVKIIISVRGE